MICHPAVSTSDRSPPALWGHGAGFKTSCPSTPHSTLTTTEVTEYCVCYCVSIAMRSIAAFTHLWLSVYYDDDDVQGLCGVRASKSQIFLSGMLRVHGWRCLGYCVCLLQPPTQGHTALGVWLTDKEQHRSTLERNILHLRRTSLTITVAVRQKEGLQYSTQMQIFTAVLLQNSCMHHRTSFATRGCGGTGRRRLSQIRQLK